jgi:hypothetical protein
VGPNPFVPYAPIDQGIPPLNGPDLSTGRVPLDPAADMRSIGPTNEMNRGYIHSWNAVVERKLPGELIVSAGYVGTASVNQIADLDLNTAGPGQGQAGKPFFRYNGRVGLTSYWDGWLDSHYNSLQVSANRPFTKGLLLKASYTLSRTINETDDTGWAGVDFNRPSADLNLGNLDAWRDAAKAKNKGPAGYDRTHVFQLGFVAELPFGRNGQGGALNPVIKDWQVNGIVSAYTGRPFTVTSSGDTLNAPGNLQTADLVGTPHQMGSVQVDPDRPNVTLPFYDTAAWKPVTDVRFGNTGRNSVRGPGAHTVDLSIFRNFPFGTRSKLEARWEIFNLFNSPVLNNPTGLVTSRNFMRITSTANGLVFDRQMQFGLRFLF